MPQQIVMPNEKPFAELVTTDQAASVTAAFEKILLASFATDAAREAIVVCGVRGKPKMTMAEIKRRFNILTKWFGILRTDLGWSVVRILDILPSALRKELDGEEFVPSNRSSW